MNSQDPPARNASEPLECGLYDWSTSFAVL